MSHGQLSSLKTLVLQSLGRAAVGRLEYFLKPSLHVSWGGPMNGQLGRQRMCRDVMVSLKPTAIVETGTFRGTTTAFLAGFGVPVYSVEADPRYYAFAKLKLRLVRRLVKLALGDSRSFLQRLATDSSMPKSSVFFYLDAHWDVDLPLAGEIRTILDSWKASVIMIDDFAVPGDSYRYDDYGPGLALDASYIAALGRSDFDVFYPSLRASEETGKKRGCVVLCNDSGLSQRLRCLASLREA
jgi:hypothetical protein